MRTLFVLCLCAWACGDDDGVDGAVDAGTDAADAGTDAPTDTGPRDAGSDLGPGMRDAGPLPDGGPPSTGCEATSPMVAPLVELPPAPDAHPLRSGPGGPARTFVESERLTSCAHLDGGPMDSDHHNTVFMYDGHLLMPWAHEHGEGSIGVFEFDDPCAPVSEGQFYDARMRETHAAGIGRIGNGAYLVTASLRGILIWEVTDLSDIHVVSELVLPDVTYPNSYARVVMSTSWQAPYIYVGASDNGVFVVDASDPSAPVIRTQLHPDPVLRVGGVHAFGTLLAVFSSEGTRTNYYDIGDPVRPRAISSVLLTDGTRTRLGMPALATSYFSHLNGDYAYYARHLFGGGLIVYDISDPALPTFMGHWGSPDDRVNGGYVFIRNELAFVGLSSQGEIVDVSDPRNPERVGVVHMTGDLDTMVPVGNVIVASVDDDAVPDEATSVFPWDLAPDTRAPRVNRVIPADGALNVPLVARVGLSFDEPIDFVSVFDGSVRLRELDAAGSPVGGAIPANASGQEGLVNLAPQGRLKPNTTYAVEAPAGGVMDASGNRTATAFRSTFTTATCE